MRSTSSLLATGLAIGFGAAACSPAQPANSDIEDGFVVADGKEDNYVSAAALEYVFEGRSSVTVEEGMGEERARELISLKHVAIAWFLNQYLVDKESEEANAGYGGFNSMVKAGSYEDLAIEQKDSRTYEFTFSQLVAGPSDLMSRLPLEDGVLSLEIGRPTNDEMARLETNYEWYRQSPWSEWNPDNVSADQKETLALAVREETRSADAWWDYSRLLDDGKLTIDVHFGWDYHNNYHLVHSRSFYGWLTMQGFESPVASFDDYTRVSGPLTKTISANGRDIQVEVRIFYGKPGTDTDPDTDAGGRVLEDDMRASLRDQDVIVYSGHSGSFYGFALANWKKTAEGDFDDAEMWTADMPADRYQIVVAEGCDTFMIGPALLGNSNKNGANIDVVTTTSFSNASTPQTVQTFVSRLLETDGSGRHSPSTILSLLTELEDSLSYGFSTLYGVHGVDDNPHAHPYASTDKLCDQCSKNAECGGPGNACIKVGSSGKRCAFECTDNSGCPSGYSCKKVASGFLVYATMCVPSDMTCE